MCEQNRNGRDVRFVQKAHEWFGCVLAGIDYDALTGIVVRDDVAVGLEHSRRESGDEHGSSSCFGVRAGRTQRSCMVFTCTSPVPDQNVLRM